MGSILWRYGTRLLVLLRRLEDLVSRWGDRSFEESSTSPWLAHEPNSLALTSQHRCVHKQEQHSLARALHRTPPVNGTKLLYYKLNDSWVPKRQEVPRAARFLFSRRRGLLSRSQTARCGARIDSPR